MKRIITYAIAAAIAAAALGAAPTPASAHQFKERTDLIGLPGGWTLYAYAPQCNGGGFPRGGTCHGEGRLATSGDSLPNQLTVCYGTAPTRTGPWTERGCIGYGGGSSSITGPSVAFSMNCQWYRTQDYGSVKKGGQWHSSSETSIAVKPAGC